MKYDDKVVQCFLKNQLRLFPEPVAEDDEEVAYFLEDVDAVVVKSAKEVKKYFKDEGVDLEGEDPLDQAEVFDVGDGRYLIVEA
ncbi:MAG: glyoxalase [Eubacteriales bacterium]|jgi:hypothetical protein